MSEKTTRERLIDAAYEEIYSKGFQGACLADILSAAGVHKGSMYYFFASKKELGLAVVDERVRPAFVDAYNSDVCLDGLMDTLKNSSSIDFKRGCPLMNLAQEMSNLDEDFDTALKQIYEEFKEKIRQILDKAVQNKQMRECDTDGVAEFIIALRQGAIFAGKISGDAGSYDRAAVRLEKYLGLFRLTV